MPTLESTMERSVLKPPSARVFDAPARAKLQAMLLEQMPLSANVDPRLREALEHLLENPGSLSRPRLAMRTAMAYGLAEKQACDLAVALEYFHTASLVFDDLPCMDDAAQRRNVACVHLAFGESQAILAALALVNRAYALLWRTIASGPGSRLSTAADYVEENLGTEGLLNGQSLDLNYGSLPHDGETTERIAYGKTVSLIRLSLVLPAILGDAGDTEVHLLERVARYWGFAYQVLDDLKDVLESSGETGKTGGRDAVLDRPNVSLSIGTEPAIRRLTQFIRIGDRSLMRLLRERPELVFLEELRNDLERQLASLQARYDFEIERGRA